LGPPYDVPPSLILVLIFLGFGLGPNQIIIMLWVTNLVQFRSLLCIGFSPVKIRSVPRGILYEEAGG
jgi:hypothetical protein